MLVFRPEVYWLLYFKTNSSNKFKTIHFKDKNKKESRVTVRFIRLTTTKVGKINKAITIGINNEL